MVSFPPVSPARPYTPPLLTHATSCVNTTAGGESTVSRWSSSADAVSRMATTCCGWSLLKKKWGQSKRLLHVSAFSVSATVILCARHNPNAFSNLVVKVALASQLGWFRRGHFSWGPLCYLKGSPPYVIVISRNCSTGAVKDVPLWCGRGFRSTELQHIVENISGGDLRRHTQER